MTFISFQPPRALPAGWAWCPITKLVGARLLATSPFRENYIAKALRHAANSIGNQKDHELTPFFKRIAFKKGRVAAIIATARKLAVIIWNMIVKAQPYQKSQVEVNNQKQRALRLKQLNKRLHALQLSKEEVGKPVFKTLSVT